MKTKFISASNLKRFCFFFFLILVQNLVFSQENVGNPSFFKLFITNENNEVLLVKQNKEWELPGVSYRNSYTIARVLELTAKQLGIKIKETKLSAQITFHYEGKANPTIMIYYSAKYESGTLKTPNWGEDVKWSSQIAANESIPYPEMKYIMKKIRENPNTLWGGALKITFDSETKRREGGYELIEEFYPL